jgi:protein ImuB
VGAIEAGPVRTLAVWCADWPTVAVRRDPPSPVAVVDSNRVVAASPAAREHGVVPGLRLREAQARCPSVEIHGRDDQRDARAFEVVLSALERFTPRLEVAEPGRCAVPARGPSRYHGGDRALSESVLDAVRGDLARHIGGGCVPCPVGVAIADGPRAAAIAAEEAAARSAGAGPMVVPRGGTAAFLARLPVERLVGGRSWPGSGVEELVVVLRRLGLRTIGRFAALPAPDVSARFGALGMELHRLARGEEVEPPNVSDPPTDLRVSAAIDPPAERVDRAAFIAKALADTLHHELSSRGLACMRVQVVAETDAGDRIERLWRHGGALGAAEIAQRVRWQLDGWLDTGRSLGRCSGGVSMLELVPDQVVADTGLQLGFWGGASAAGERAVRALARVQALVGADAVLVPEWRGGRSPGEQYRLVPFDTVPPERTAVGAAEDGPPWPGRLPAPAPAVVWPEPLLAEVLDADGNRVGVGGRGLISSPPRRCRVDGGPWTTVRAWAGPWCVDERWWDALAHRRRARVQVVLGEPGGHPSTGVAHVLALESGQWWLEATYD